MLLLKPCDSLSGEDPARRTPVDADVLRFVILEQRSIYRGDIFARCGKLVLGTLSVGDRDDGNPPDARHRDGFNLASAAFTPQKCTAMQIDQDAVALFGSHAFLWRNDLHFDTSEHLAFDADGVD